MSCTKVRIKVEILLNSCHTFDYYAFISRYLLENFIFLQSRAVVAYGCLFSDLRYNCNTCTQVAHTEILLILRKSSNSDKDTNNKQ